MSPPLEWLAVIFQISAHAPLPYWDHKHRPPLFSFFLPGLWELNPHFPGQHVTPLQTAVSSALVFCSPHAIAFWVSGSSFPPGVAGLHSCIVTTVPFVFGWRCGLWASASASSSLPGTLSRESPFLRLLLCPQAFLGASVSLCKCELHRKT